MDRSGRGCPVTATRFRDGVAVLIAHLQGLENALEPLGWTGRKAEWIALACLHGEGVFTRVQLAFHLQMNRLQTFRFVQALVRAGLAAEDSPEDQKVCRIFGPGIYQALGAEDIRHRRVASSEILFRRLLSLDYVIEHAGLPWLPTDAEKVRAFDALGIDRRLLPLRVYRGAVGETRRYFPLKFPIALEAGRAIFVFVDPGYDTATALRSWGRDHRRLWEVLREQGRTIKVVAVAREIEALERARRVLSRWADIAASPGDPLAGREIARIERAILKGNVRVLDEYGNLQGTLKRIVALKKSRSERPLRADHRGFFHLVVKACSWNGILSPKRGSSRPIETRTQTMGSMCTENVFRRARQRFRSLLSPLGFRPFRCLGPADPDVSEADGSAPPLFWPWFGRGAVACVHSSAPPPRGGRSRHNDPCWKARIPEA